MNTEIAVVENEMIERGLATVGRHDMRDEAQKSLLGRHGNRTDVTTCRLQWMQTVPVRLGNWVHRAGNLVRSVHGGEHRSSDR
jgi:hypothetical protein